MERLSTRNSICIKVTNEGRGQQQWMMMLICVPCVVATSEDLLKNKSCWHGGPEPVTNRRMEELGSIYAKKMSGLYRVGNLRGFLLAIDGIINSIHRFLLVLRIQSIWVHLYV